MSPSIWSANLAWLGDEMPGELRKRLIGSALSVIAMVAVMTACASSQSDPDAQAASPTKASPTQEFVSKRDHFSVTLPQDWSETDASLDWSGLSLSGPGSPAFANFDDPTRSHILMAGEANKVPAGMTLAQWQAQLVRGTPTVCPQPSSSAEATTLDGEPALQWWLKCSDGWDVTFLAALHGKHGYVLPLLSATANDDAQDQSIFEDIRQSFRFTA